MLGEIDAILGEFSGSAYPTSTSRFLVYMFHEEHLTVADYP